MSFLTSGGLLRNKVTADLVRGEEVVEESVRKSSCSSILGPLGTQGDCKALNSGPENQGYSIKEKQAWKQLENGIPKLGCIAAPEEEPSAVDQLVCKLVSQLCILPDAFTDLHEKELEEPSLDISSTLNECKAQAVFLDGETEEHELLAPYKKEINGSVLEVATGFNANYTRQVTSAFRGGFAKAGLGNRPKLHVTWAPDVVDPPCTSPSHTRSQSCRRHHHHPKSEQKSRHKGKGSSHADSQKKLQKKIQRKLRNTNETFVRSSPTFLPPGVKQNRDIFEEQTAPLWNDFWSAKVSPLILPQKLVRPLSERELVCLGKIKSYGIKHVTHNLSL